MLKIFLKHAIYEICIKVLFEQITLNFSDIESDIQRILKVSARIASATRNIDANAAMVNEPMGFSEFYRLQCMKEELKEVKRMERERERGRIYDVEVEVGCEAGFHLNHD